MGYLLLALVAVATLLALWLLGVTRASWSIVGAGLIFGTIGYAWQGKPLMAGADPRPSITAEEISPATIALRERLLGRFTADAAYLVAAEAMTRSGARNAAASVMLAGARRYPRSFIIWTGLGTTLAARDGDQVSPAALLAFRQAGRLAPEHPAPPFYLGLAHARAGETDRTRILWRRAIALSPEGTSYRRDIAALLAGLDRSTPPR